MASVLEEVLVEEYGRAYRHILHLRHEMGSLPRGYVSEKVISGRRYCYLQWRDGGHVRSRYLRPEEVGPAREGCARRRRLAKCIKAQEHDLSQIRRALGGGFDGVLEGVEAEAESEAEAYYVAVDANEPFYGTAMGTRQGFAPSRTPDTTTVRRGGIRSR